MPWRFISIVALLSAACIVAAYLCGLKWVIKALGFAPFMIAGTAIGVLFMYLALRIADATTSSEHEWHPYERIYSALVALYLGFNVGMIILLSVKYRYDRFYTWLTAGVLD